MPGTPHGRQPRSSGGEATSPPVLLIHGLKDRVWKAKRNKRLERRLKAASKYVETFYMAGEGHILSLLAQNQATAAPPFPAALRRGDAGVEKFAPRAEDVAVPDLCALQIFAIPFGEIGGGRVGFLQKRKQERVRIARCAYRVVGQDELADVLVVKAFADG
jgi:hypothetical protein